MHLTALAASIADFCKIKVFNPILYVSRAPERKYDFVFSFLISDVAWSNSHKIADMANLPKIIELFSALAIPNF